MATATTFHRIPRKNDSRPQKTNCYPDHVIQTGYEDDKSNGRPPSMAKIRQWAQNDGKVAQQRVTAHGRCEQCRVVYPMSVIRTIDHWLTGSQLICTFCLKTK